MDKSLVEQIEKNLNFLYYCAIKYCPDRNDADDVVQESIVRMHKYYKKEKFTRSWMSIIVSSVALYKKSRDGKYLHVEENDFNSVYHDNLEENDFSSRSYHEYLLKVLDISINSVKDDLQRKILKEIRKGKKKKDLKFKNVSDWKIGDSYCKAMIKVKKLTKKNLEIYEY